MSEALQHLNVVPVREGSRSTLFDETRPGGPHIVLDTALSAHQSASLGSPVLVAVGRGTLLNATVALSSAEVPVGRQQVSFGSGQRSATLAEEAVTWQPVARWEGAMQSSAQAPIQFLLSIEPSGASEALPCEDLFRQLARLRPLELARHLHCSSYSAGLRARAAEAAGDIADTQTAVSLLLPLLSDAAPIVREGAIYGLERHLIPEVRQRLKALVDASDTTDGVRSAALEALDEG